MMLYLYNNQLCPKHIEVEWRNKLRINRASSWLLLHRYFENHGQQNIKFMLLFLQSFFYVTGRSPYSITSISCVKYYKKIHLCSVYKRSLRAGKMFLSVLRELSPEDGDSTLLRISNRHVVTSHKTWIFINTAITNSNIERN